MKFRFPFPRSRSRRLILFGVIATFLLITGYFGAVGFLLVQDARVLLKPGRGVAHAARLQDLQMAKEELVAARASLTTVKQRLRLVGFLKFIPFVGAYEEDAERGIRAGFHLLDTSFVFVDALEPYADILGLKGQGSFTGGTAQERMKKVVQTIDKVNPELEKLAQSLSAARIEIDGIDAKRYPLDVRKLKLKSSLALAKTLLHQADSVLTDARPIVKVLPKILGEPDMQTYLVLFQNDKELRPTGGFLTAYAIMRTERGSIVSGGSEDIYRLDDRRGGYVPPPDPIRRFLPQPDGAPAAEWNIRDTNLSPDWKVSAETFAEFYKNVAGREELDGIIALDTHVLEDLLKVTGPVNAAGLTFSAEKDPRCDCPGVVYELENYAEKTARVAIAKGFNVERKGILADLMTEVLRASMGAGKEKFAPLFETFVRLGREKHILLYFMDPESQKSAETIQWAGRMREFDGDYLHINDANFAGAKANLYVTQAVEQEVAVDSDGTVTKTVAIEYRNPKEDDGWLNGQYRSYIRLYVPKGSELVSSSGSEVEVGVSEDLGRTVFDGFYRLNPKNIVKLTFTYKLPMRVSAEYLIFLQKQPGTEAPEHTFIINGKTKPPVELVEDKVLTFPL
ncbi:MAG: DUF4012 domain-containing protein [bacterium]|nr:DUF4012 domain-containing protein [bacterium]